MSVVLSQGFFACYILGAVALLVALITDAERGLCESGWHTDCAQLPLTATASAGQCSCPCH